MKYTAYRCKCGYEAALMMYKRAKEEEEKLHYYQLAVKWKTRWKKAIDAF